VEQDPDRRQAPQWPAAASLRESIERLYPEMPAWQRSMTLFFMRFHHWLAFAAADRLLRRWSARDARQRRDERGP
jgi:hypothetical protein